MYGKVYLASFSKNALNINEMEWPGWVFPFLSAIWHVIEKWWKIRTPCYLDNVEYSSGSYGMIFFCLVSGLYHLIWHEIDFRNYDQLVYNVRFQINFWISLCIPRLLVCFFQLFFQDLFFKFQSESWTCLFEIQYHKWLFLSVFSVTNSFSLFFHYNFSFGLWSRIAERTVM